MKIFNILIALSVVLSISGCTSSKLYKSTYTYSGANTDECNELCLSVATKSDLGLVRTVAENGQFTLFFKSDKSPLEIQKNLFINGKDLPASITIGKVKSISNLPPKPKITNYPNLSISPNSQKMAELGVSIIDINKALQSVKLSDPDFIKKAVIKRADGTKILLQDIAEITIEKEPSHIVKDY